MFSALRQGNPFYILEKGSKLNLKVGQVEWVSSPKPKYNNNNVGVALSPIIQTVVDIKVIVDNEKLEFNNVPSSLSIADFGNGVVISESKESILSEVDGIMQSSTQILNNIEYHENVVKDCEQILKQFNPVFAKEKEHDDAIEDLKSQMGNIKNEFGSVKDSISKILSLLTTAESK